MNKRQLAEKMAKMNGTSYVKAYAALDDVMNTLAAALLEGERVQITGVGTWQVVDSGVRKARNPQTGEKIDVKPSKRVRFRAGGALTDMLNGKREITDRPGSKAARGTITTEGQTTEEQDGA